MMPITDAEHYRLMAAYYAARLTWCTRAFYLAECSWQGQSERPVYAQSAWDKSLLAALAFRAAADQANIPRSESPQALAASYGWLIRGKN